MIMEWEMSTGKWKWHEYKTKITTRTSVALDDDTEEMLLFLTNNMDTSKTNVIRKAIRKLYYESKTQAEQ